MAELDWNKAEEIRRRAAAGEPRLEIAADSRSRVAGLRGDRRSGLEPGHACSPAGLDEAAAVDDGAGHRRAPGIDDEVQLKHIDFDPVKVTIDGEARDVLVIEVQSKREKSTSEKERVYADTERLISWIRTVEGVVPRPDRSLRARRWPGFRDRRRRRAEPSDPRRSSARSRADRRSRAPSRRGERTARTPDSCLISLSAPMATDVSSRMAASTKRTPREEPAV